MNWTPAEDALLRERYEGEGAYACADVLRRDVKSVLKRAQRLSLRRRPRWTPREDKFLRDNWGDVDLAGLAKSLGRSKLTIYWRAGKLGLPRGCPQGFEYLTAAAKRTGYEETQLRRILKWAGVELRRTLSRPDVGAASGYHCVVPFDVDTALAAWHKTETIEVAARRHGLSGGTLKRWLREAVAAGEPMPPEPRKPRVQWRVLSETIDLVVRRRRDWVSETETVRHAAHRLRVDQQTLTGWLRKAGIPKPDGWVWRLPTKTIDAVIEERVARGCRAKPAEGRAA